MDSGSGSLQSSSGGDEDYDSHHHQQPLFFPPPPLFFNNNNIPPPPPPPPLISSQQQQQQQPLPFHLPHHNYQNQFHPPPNFYDFPSNFNFHPDSSHNSFLNNPTSLTSEPTADGSTQIPIPPSSSSGVLHPKPTTKKRTRASRRAPTTILTTDTTNFRAMVQEFTGIPSPPFTAGGSTSYSSRRFDLFGSLNLEAASGSGSGLYPSRSSKVQLFSSLSNENVAVAVEDQNVSNLQQQQRAQAGIFSFRSLSEGSHLEQPHIHGSSSSQQLVSALQNDETWRANGGGTAATATAATATHSNNNNAAAGNCKLNFTGSSSSSSMNNLQRDKEMLLGNIIVSTTTTRGENTVDSWIYPSD